jgi:hypothetical protein
MILTHLVMFHFFTGASESATSGIFALALTGVGR